MSFVRRVIAAVLVVCVTTASVGVAHAQAPQVSSSPASQTPAGSPASNDTMAAGLVDGELLAESKGTGGPLGAGLGVGVLTGLIGTGIGYFVIGGDQLSAEALQRSAGRSPDYQLGLKTGWERKTKARKRNAFLAGGLLGTAAFFVIYASAAGNAQ